MPPRPAHPKPSVSPQQSAGYSQYPQYPQLHPQDREGIEPLLSRKVGDTIASAVENSPPAQHCARLFCA